MDLGVSELLLQNTKYAYALFIISRLHSRVGRGRGLEAWGLHPTYADGLVSWAYLLGRALVESIRISWVPCQQPARARARYTGAQILPHCALAA